MQASNFKNWISTQGQCAALFLLLAACGLVIPSPIASAQSNEILSTWQTAEDRQFDFWIGKWDVNLRIRQADSSWKNSVDAKVEIHPILDGKAVLELWDSSTIKGFSLRYFDHARKKWILFLNWPSNGDSSSIGSLTGQFRHGRGEFFSGSGENISRYTFCDIAPDSLRWDDAYSQDGGKTWTNKWIMEFSRTAKVAQWPSGTDGHTLAPEGRCKGEQFELLNRMVGSWEGELDFDNDDIGVLKVKMKAYRVLGGCSVIRFLEYTTNDSITVRVFGILTWNAKRGMFEELVLDNQKDSSAELFRGKADGSTIRLSSEPRTNQVSTKRGHVWTLPQFENGELTIEISSSEDGASWMRGASGTLTRISAIEDDAMSNDNVEQDKTDGQPINQVCPRSGKPVVSECTS